MSAAQFTEPADASRLLVADSFRVRGLPGEAQVRRLDLHIDRFTRSVVEALGPRSQQLHALNDFVADSVRRINEYGEVNPRLELWDGDVADFRLSLRPLPELRNTIDLVSVKDVPTEHADRKGPNIELFTKLNRELGAEALLLDSQGGIIEGATTALIWWAGNRGFVSANTHRVASVTEQIVAKIARERGDALEPMYITATELAKHEVWAVNALHGIRPVTRIDDVLLPEPDPHHLHSFQGALDRTWAPVNVISHTLAW